MSRLHSIFFIFSILCRTICAAEEEPKRRALPAPFDSPPFPGSEYQGSPLIGVPPSDSDYPLMEAIYKTPCGDAIKESRIQLYGWINGSGNLSNCKDSNTPEGYWIVPNQIELDQFILRLERQVDTVQMDTYDIGFRSTFLYGIDYRYTMGGGWNSYQLLEDNNLYGYDFPEQYIDFYTPYIAEGVIMRVGRWISCPDIESQFTTDTYLGSHSLLFIFDTFTQTGILFTAMLNKNWTVQAGIHAGSDMAPWYKGAVPTGVFGVRWVADSNRDSIYLMLNSINGAKFRYFHMYDEPLGHDNYNYLCGSWQHKFSDKLQTRTESYIMWQQDAALGGTPSAGPVEPFGGGGGIGPTLPGTTWTWGVLNYTMYAFSKKGFVTLRNELYHDIHGQHTGYPGIYTTSAFGVTYNFNSIVQIRPEIGYYKNWDHKAFDNGRRRHLVMAGVDMTVRF